MGADDEEELLAAIAADPDDAQAREVYADWLDNRDDLRGEYLRLEALFHSIPAKLVMLSAGFDPTWLTRVSRHCDVRLTKVGANKIMCIKLVRELTGLGLREAVDLVNATDSPLVVGAVDHDAAMKIRAQFQDAGCEVAIVGVGTSTPRATSVPAAIPVTRGLNVMLEAITDVRGAVSVVRTIRGCGIKEAFRIVNQVATGTPFQIAAGVPPKRATEILTTFAPVGRAVCTSATPGI